MIKEKFNVDMKMRTKAQPENENYNELKTNKRVYWNRILMQNCYTFFVKKPTCFDKINI